MYRYCVMSTTHAFSLITNTLYLCDCECICLNPISQCIDSSPTPIIYLIYNIMPKAPMVAANARNPFVMVAPLICSSVTSSVFLSS